MAHIFLHTHPQPSDRRDVSSQNRGKPYLSPSPKPIRQKKGKHPTPNKCENFILTPKIWQWRRSQHKSIKIIAKRTNSADSHIKNRTVHPLLIIISQEKTSYKQNNQYTHTNTTPTDLYLEYSGLLGHFVDGAVLVEAAYARADHDARA